MTLEFCCEWGQSHGGSLTMAKRQALATKTVGAQWAKWQVFSPERLASRHAKRYWDEALGGSDGQLETFTDNGNLSDAEWHELARYCRDVAGVRFLATPFDMEAVDLLGDIGVDAIKIASGDLTHRPLLRRIGETGKHVILSTGAAFRWEVTQALGWIGHDDVTLLACSLAYPTAPRDALLARVPWLAKIFGWGIANVGLSDHTTLVETGMAAAVLGAQFFEKHSTLDPGGGVPDDRMALDPQQLKEYVRLAQLGATLRGSNVISPSSSEMPAREGARRSIYANRDLPAGHILSESDFAFLRPCPRGAPSPAEADRLVGKALSSGVKVGELIRP